jgi:PAS domain S-box-containing protein
MGFSRVSSITLAETWWRIIILLLSAGVIGISVWCLSVGITNIFMHLYYFPIILLTYRYRWRGFAVALLLATAYLVMVIAFDTGQIDIITGAFYRFLVFAGIAAVVAYLSGRLAVAQDTLQRNQQFQESVIANANIWITVLSPDGTILVWNEAAVSISGYRKEGVIGRNTIWKQLYPDREYRKKVTHEIQQVIRKNAFLENFETQIQCADRTEKSIVWNTRGLKDEAGTITSYIAIGRDVTAQKAAEQNLRESEEKYRTLIEKANEALIIAQDEVFVFANASMSRLLGVPVEDLIGKPFADFIWPEDRDLVVTRYHKRNAGENVPDSYDFRITGAGGRMRWVSITAAQILWQGRPATLNLLNDITERKRIEEALLESESFNRGLVENLPDYLAVYGLDGSILYVNPASARALGYDADSLIGRPVLSFVAEECRDLVKSKMTTRLNAGVPQPYEIELVSKSGIRRSVIVKAAPIHYRNNPAILLLLVDITDRRKAEEALRQSEEKFRIIADYTFDWEYWLAPDGTYAYMSPSCERITGYSTGEFYKNPLLYSEIIHPDDRAAYREHIDLSSASPDPESAEFRIIRKDGAIRWISHICQPMFGNSGKLLGRRSSNRDDTDRKLAEIAVQESEEKYRVFFTTSRDCVFITTHDGRWVDFNDAAVELFGYESRQDLMEVKVPQIYANPEDRIAHLNYIRKKGYSFEYSVDLKKKDGTIIKTLITTTAKKDPAGNIIGFQGSIRDITEQKRTERLLVENQTQLATAMDLAHLANWEFDVRTGIFTFNDRFYAMYGTTAEREGGYQMPAERYAREFVHPDDAGMVAEEVRKAVETHDPLFTSQAEHRIIRRDGAIRYITVRFAVTKDAAGLTIKTHGANQDITERRQAEVALQKSEHHSAMLLKAIPDMMFIISSSGVYREFHVPDVTALAVPAEKIIGTNIRLSGFGKDSVDIILANIARAIETKKLQLFEYQLEVPRGLRQYEARMVALNDEDVLAIVRDITERKNAEAEIRESKQLFSDIISFLPDPTFVIDRDGKVLAWNRALEQLSGVSASQMIGKGDHEYSLWQYGKRRPLLIDLVLHPERDAGRMSYTDIHEDGSTITAQNHITRPDGRKILLSLVVSPLFDSRGMIIGAIESMRDITRIKETEAELARLNANLEDIVRKRTQALNDEIAHRIEAEREVQVALDYTRSVIEANPDLVVVLDREGKILDINAAGETLTGIPSNELIGNPYFGFLEDDGTLRSAFTRLLDEGIIENFVRIRRTDGHLTPLSVHATVVKGPGGTGDRIIVSAHDITRQKQNEDAIRASLEEKVILLREIHHRVKNNLQIIISLTNLQMRKTDDPGVKLIMAETQNRVRAMSLVHEKLYRSDNLSQIDFADYTRFLATQLFSFYSTDTRRVKLDLAMKQIMVDINTAVPLGLIMNELVSNALKHAFPGGRSGTITISGQRQGDLITLAVTDNGVGMPRDLDWKNTESLGLRLITSLVDQVSGTIERVSDGGTAFTITLEKKPDQNVAN